VSEGGEGARRTERRRAAWTILTWGNLTLVVTVAQGLILVPLYLRFLGVRLYGAWLGSAGVVGWLGLVDVGVASLMIQRMSAALGRDDRREAGQYYTTGLLVQVGVAVVMAAAALGMAAHVPGWMGVALEDTRTFELCFLGAAIAGAITVINNAVSGLAFALQSPALPTIAGALASLLGFAVTGAILFSGYGLWAIAWGMLARSGALLAANAAFAGVLLGRRIPLRLAPSRAVVRDFARLAPPMLAGSAASAVGGRTEPALIAMMLSPELAAVYSLTRRAADVAGMILSRIGAAAFPGFAHLVASRDRSRAPAVLAEVRAGFGAAATLMLGTFVALDRSFVSLWVGSRQFGGLPLVVLVAGAVFISSRNGIMSYLFGATGEIARSSLVIGLEAVVRIALMAALLSALGLLGLPLAVLVTGAVMAFVLGRLMSERLGGRTSSVRGWRVPLPILIQAAVFAAALAVGATVAAPTWSALVALGASFVVVALGAMTLLDVRMRNLGRDLLRWVWTPARGEV
jgi:O-antigen/teichoic acid export membrane protein